MKEIKTPRGTFNVPDHIFTEKSARDNGFHYYFTFDDGDIYIKHIGMYNCKFVLVKPYLRMDDVTILVKSHIRDYIKEHNLGELRHVIRMSNHPDDNYLYGVVVQKNDRYSCWTSWNETTNSLNFGHYGFEFLEDAIKTLKKYYYDCSR